VPRASYDGKIRVPYGTSSGKRPRKPAAHVFVGSKGCDVFAICPHGYLRGMETVVYLIVSAVVIVAVVLVTRSD
jgi:hypothetical protein